MPAKAKVKATVVQNPRSSFMPDQVQRDDGDDIAELDEVLVAGVQASVGLPPSSPTAAMAAAGSQQFSGFGRHNQHEWKQIPSIADLHAEHTKLLHVGTQEHLKELTQFPSNVRDLVASYLEAQDVLFLGTTPIGDDSYFLHVPTKRVYSLRYWSILKVSASPGRLAC